MSEIFEAELVPEPIDSSLNVTLISTGAVAITFLILAATFGVVQLSAELNSDLGLVKSGEPIRFTFGEPVYLPRDPACIDENNGQDLPEYGIGYEPSLSVDSEGNLFITAHKDLRWGGEETPVGLNIFLESDAGYWYACTDQRSIWDHNSGPVQTSWDYWASWFWISSDNGTSWGPGDQFPPTPGNYVEANYVAGGSECLGDEGDISVDGLDRVYYLDTTLEDNWWHIFTDGGQTYEMGVCQRMNTMAGDDRPWVAAQGDGIIHYLGNSGIPPPECTGDPGRYWYYHSENQGNTFSQCYSVPGGWSTIASQRNGPYVHIAQENADSASGTVHVRTSPDHGRGTGFNDGTWEAPVNIGPRDGNCPEGYPVVNLNERGTVAVVWADCPAGDVGAWEIRMAISYDNASTWEDSWNITPSWAGVTMYPFVSISEDNMLTVSFYGLQYGDDGYTVGDEWYLYAGGIQEPHSGDQFIWQIADPTPLHVVNQFEQDNNDLHALHDFFETVHAPDGSWVGIAYQQNIGEHPFEVNEEQRYIKFVRGERLDWPDPDEKADNAVESTIFINQIMAERRELVSDL